MYLYAYIHGLPTLNLALRASDHEIWARQRESWGSLLPAPCLAAARRLLVELLFEFIMCVLPFNFARHNLMGPKCVGTTIEL